MTALAGAVATLTSTSSSAVGPLAQSTLQENAGPIGLLVILLLGVATVLLIRNMDKRVKNLPREFPDPPPRPGRDEPPAA